MARWILLIITTYEGLQSTANAQMRSIISSGSFLPSARKQTSKQTNKQAHFLPDQFQRTNKQRHRTPQHQAEESGRAIEQPRERTRSQLNGLQATKEASAQRASEQPRKRATPMRPEGRTAYRPFITAHWEASEHPSERANKTARQGANGQTNHHALRWPQVRQANMHTRTEASNVACKHTRKHVSKQAQARM